MCSGRRDNGLPQPQGRKNRRLVMALQENAWSSLPASSRGMRNALGSCAMKDERESKPVLILTPSVWDTPPELASERSAPKYAELLMELVLVGFVIALMVGLSIVFPINPAHLAHAGDRHVAIEAEP